MMDQQSTDPQSPSKMRRLSEFLAAHSHALPTEDVLHVMLPLMRAVTALHEQGKVAALGLNDVLEMKNGGFGLVHPEGLAPSDNIAEIQRIQPAASSALKVVGEYRVTNDESVALKVEDLLANDNEHPIIKPVYLIGLRSWEIAVGHHDEITDIFNIGMIMACVACGIDPANTTEIENFSFNRHNLFAIQSRLHPVLATLILESTALNRHDRATDLAALTKRLETYRDQPLGLEVDRVMASASGIPGRRAAVLTHLRDRLFDLSRRNRLIYFRATQSSVNLTEASVPIVMRLESIRPDQLCTWTGSFVADILAGKAVPLNKWLRFEDQPQLPSNFDRTIQETRRDRVEYGFSHLRLVVGFLRWHNLKEAPEERIVSPLLWLTVAITKAKGVRDQYVLHCAEPIAEFNPALRHLLRQLYDIQLPETVDLTSTSIEAIHQSLLQQIQKTEPGVRLDLQKRPQIRVILQRAVQRVRQFNRKRRQGKEQVTANVEFSYDGSDYRPLGLALFEKFVRPSPLPQRLAAGGSNRPSLDFMVAETESKTYAIGVDQGHRFAWELDLTQVTLANFNYRKMSLVRDFSELIDQPQAQPAFDQVFSIEPRPFVQEQPPKIPLQQQWNVVAADATQNAAVALARQQRSFIVQGPPGTGKSQTITNLIADYAGRGKRVLFVCEKRAALDVVFQRLGKAGLDGLSCIIHDSQEDKKSFILDLKTQYENWGKNDDSLKHVIANRSQTVTTLAQQLDEIQAFDKLMGGDVPPSARGLVRRAAGLPKVENKFDGALREQLPRLNMWDAHRTLAEKLTRSMRENFGATSLATHPFARLNKALISSARPYAKLEAMITEAEAILLRLDAWLEGGSTFASSNTAFIEARATATIAAQMQSTGLGANITLLNETSAASEQLQQDTQRYSALRSAYEAARAEASHWKKPLSPEDTKSALAQAKQQETSLFRHFSGSWRKLKNEVRQRYDFSAHAVEPSIGNLLTKLQTLHEAEAALTLAWNNISTRFGTSELLAFTELRKRLINGSEQSNATLKMLAAAHGAAHPATVIANDAAQSAHLEKLGQLLSSSLESSDELNFEQINQMLGSLRENLDDLPSALPLLADVHKADPQVGFALRNFTLPQAQLEALVVDEELSRLERAHPEIQQFDIERLMQLTRRAATAKDELRHQNAQAITANLHRAFRDNVKLSETSETMLDIDKRRFKKRYATGRRELEREFEKTMRYRSIRDLAEGDTGLVVNDLKPIWLMSPLSVSDTLPLQSNLFDVVIFDEASQIPMEEAVPALCRSEQVIVVGDEMQLPPTSFFSTALDEDEMEVAAEEDGEKISIALDADSLLNQSARNLPATLLAWHYRSRYEALINFSNAAFYNGNLVTIPDQMLHATAGKTVAVTSSDAKAWEQGAERLLQVPISTHRIADGVYERRSNPAEARYIAGIVRSLILRKSHGSIGIVAFSEAQQGELESALEVLASEDEKFAAALEQEYSREDDGQFDGLFVKNLENVQGDERDIIVMSVCYAPGRDGKMVMNFGPINQRGGEKRLNVIFSRARRHMAIVSTIAPEAISNIHNDGARALRSFLAFAEAQSNGAIDYAQTILATLGPETAQKFGAEKPRDAVRSALADALRKRGHKVHEHVGSASFRCDLAIADSDGRSFRLGILLDREADEDLDVEDRFLFRPAILRAFGWRVIDVPVTSWLRAPEQTIERIEAEIKKDSWVEPNSDTDQFPSNATDAIADQIKTPGPLPAEPAAATETMRGTTRAFRFVQGTSDKFWRVGVSECDLVVEYGRTGSKGQRVLKTYDSPERAKREAEKLTHEKTSKGYEEVT
jgi:predicted DNA-binding WGR domain protein